MKYFMSDTHFGNHNIVKMMARINTDGQRFATSEEHDDCVIKAINDTVGAEDELFILGDFADKTPEAFRKRIHCRKVRLIIGNHDDSKTASQVFQGVQALQTVTVKGGGGKTLKVVCCHYPMSFWDGSHKGYGHLYGHVHGQREGFLDEMFPCRKSMDIGIDNIHFLTQQYKPLSEVQVYNLLSATDGHDRVSFYQKFQSELYKSRGLKR